MEALAALGILALFAVLCVGFVTDLGHAIDEAVLDELWDDVEEEVRAA